jgi:protein O-GlcNAc transferase
VAVHPGHAAGWTNLGVCLTYEGKVSEALACFDRALAADPQLHHAHVGRGLALERCHRIAEACDSYARAIAGQSDHWQARSARLLCLHYLDGVSREALWREHREFGAALAVPESKPPEVEEGLVARPWRVGILSADLRRHAVASFLEPLLRHLDREEFAVVLYHDHSQLDEVSSRLRSHAAEWRHVAGLSAAALFNLMRADRLDLAIDLGGHTGINRLPLFARRLAPVQVTYLGYPDTTGLEAMDYRLVDAITDPPGEADDWHSEKLLRFAPTAWSYAPPEDAPEVAPAPVLRQGQVTFGCFNNFAKVTDAMLGHWARLLSAVPGSRLLLKGSGLGDPVLRAAAERRMAAAGLPHDRVTMLERTNTEVEHLATYAQVDVALDTFPYHGTTTTCEALWMGVPVVTLAGDRHGSRVGVSLLTAVGRADWVAHDADEYVRIGVVLASDAAQLGRDRGELREAMRRSTLLDHVGQARRFGEALRAMAGARIGNGMTVPETGELQDAISR